MIDLQFTLKKNWSGRQVGRHGVFFPPCNSWGKKKGLHQIHHHMLFIDGKIHPSNAGVDFFSDFLTLFPPMPAQ